MSLHKLPPLDFGAAAKQLNTMVIRSMLRKKYYLYHQTKDWFFKIDLRVYLAAG
jgi:hypothetical protein